MILLLNMSVDPTVRFGWFLLILPLTNNESEHEPCNLSLQKNWREQRKRSEITIGELICKLDDFLGFSLCDKTTENDEALMKTKENTAWQL